MRLRTKFCLALSAASSLFLAVFSVLVYEQARNSQWDYANQQVTGYVDRTWDNVAALKSSGPFGLTALEREGLYQKVWLDDKLIHDSFPQWAQANPESNDGILRRSERTLGGHHYKIIAFFDLWPMRESLAALKKTLWLGGLFAMGLFPAISYLLSGFLLNPFKRLSQTTSGLTAQCLNFRFETPRFDDEYGKLVKNFNLLLDRLEKSFSQTRNFATNASHELRTPLTVIRGEAELMLRRERPVAEYKAALGRILTNAGSLQKTVKQLLVLAHLQRLEHENFCNDIPLNVFVSETLESLVKAHPDKNRNRTVQVDISEHLNYCGNREVLSSIVGNLLENALKYSRGLIRVTADQSAEALALYFEDDGPGILDEHKKEVFKPFNCVGANQGGESHGLGLSITKAFVEAVRGTIELNQSILGGLSVSVVLPTC